MNILVTGGVGFIGHNVVSRLENLGHNLLIIDNMTNYGIIPEDEMNYLISSSIQGESFFSRMETSMQGISAWFENPITGLGAGCLFSY